MVVPVFTIADVNGLVNKVKTTISPVRMKQFVVLTILSLVKQIHLSADHTIMCNLVDGKDVRVRPTSQTRKVKPAL